MNRTILIPVGAILLAAVAFIAGRSGTGNVPPTPIAAPARIPSVSSVRGSDNSSEAPRAMRATTPPEESAQALLQQLAGLTVTEGSPRSARPVLVLLEQLSRLGPKALPAVRKFLISGENVSYATSGGQRLRDVKPMLNAVIPPTLRIALFDLVARSGGGDAAEILLENLDIAGNGLEVACLSELLAQMFPESAREATVAAATRLLAKGTAVDRNLLFEIMRNAGDTSYIAAARRQMIQQDGQVDRGALRYLQQAMGPQSLALAAQAYQDPRLADPGSKEPLARLALSYVGANTQALDLYHSALLDPTLLPDQKRNLVEDLNQDGIGNRKAPTPEDLAIINKRYELTQAYLQEDYVRNDDILNKAFLEAAKDLHKMLERAAANSTPGP